MSEPFLNPYNFIPVMERETSDPLFGDAMPKGHHRLQPKDFSGTITVRMEAITPLLVPEIEFEVSDGHRTKRTRVDADGRPLIPATSVKGMLRVAFESVTNSRYGIVGEQLKKKIERREREDDTSPFEVVPEYLKPAERLSQLSPADRLFGWVSETGSSERNSSWAGQLSIGPIGFPTNPRALRSPKKITLSVLASPKIQQTLFYAARSSDPKQAPKPSTTEKYEQGLLPRGRKVYPHQRDWQRSNAEEHRRKDGQVVTDKQNQTFKDWIPIGSIFEFVITVRNASANDLGGLYFLLSLADDQFHRFGGGKPLGFGSVRLRVVKHEVSSGDDWREALRELNPPFRLTNDDLEGMKNGFRTEVEKQSWGRAVLSAFEAATRGFDNLAIRYPRRFAEPKWLPLLDKSSAPVLRHTNGGGNRGGGNNPR